MMYYSTFYLRLFSLLGVSLYLSQSLIAGPPSPEAKAAVAAIKHQLNNHETEIRQIEEKLNNQEETIETLRQSLQNTGKQHKDILKDNSESFNTKIESLDSKTKSLVTDLGVLKNHANDSAALLEQYRNKIKEMETVIDAQKSQLSNLEEAVRSLMDIMQVKESLSDKKVAQNDNVEKVESGGVYRVQAGDTLEKIARRHNITIDALKEKNNLTRDRIIVGQKLTIP